MSLRFKHFQILEPSRTPSWILPEVIFYHSSAPGDSSVASYGAVGHVPPSTSNNFIFSSLWGKPDSQISKYCVTCEISWCRCQQLTALSISIALVIKLLVIE